MFSWLQDAEKAMKEMKGNLVQLHSLTEMQQYCSPSGESVYCSFSIMPLPPILLQQEMYLKKPSPVHLCSGLNTCIV